MKIISFVFVMVQLCIISGCSTYSVISYSPSQDNIGKINGGENKLSIYLDTPGFSDNGSIGCRGMGPVVVGGNQKFSDYIYSALKAELQQANLYDDKSNNKLHVRIDRVDLSHQLITTFWYIDATYHINNKEIIISSSYSQNGSPFGSAGCENLANSFKDAVATHLNNLYANTEFREFIVVINRKQQNTKTDNNTTENKLNTLLDLRNKGLISKEEYDKKREDIINNL